jgi:Rps23 Pro-64 3,4-dihydroxylase Tpa1-like proline 4-hydroxylase
VEIEKLIIEKIKTSTTEHYPFPHFLIDNLLDRDFLSEVFNDLNLLEATLPTNIFKSEFGEKKEWKYFPEHLANLNQLLNVLSDNEFIESLKEKFNINKNIKIYPDLTYDGGGYVYSPPGSFLGYHADFNFSSKTNKYRVLNILIYMNEDYQDSQGGALHLLDAKSKTVEKIVSPIANRLLAFSTDDTSFHGVSLNHDSFFRRSFNLYFYSDTPISLNQSSEPHKTIWLNFENHDH